MTKSFVSTWWGRPREGHLKARVRQAPPFRQRQVSGRWKADQRALAPRVLEALLVVGLPCRRLPLPRLAGPLLASLPHHPSCHIAGPRRFPAADEHAIDAAGSQPTRVYTQLVSISNPITSSSHRVARTVRSDQTTTETFCHLMPF